MFNTQRVQTAGKLADPVTQGPIVITLLDAVDDLLFWNHRQRRMQQLLDQERIGIGRLRMINQICRHIVHPEIERDGQF